MKRSSGRIRKTRRKPVIHSPVIEALEERRLLSLTPLPNVQVTSDPGVQQQPSLVVDPHDARHVVIAYMDHALVNSGYAGIGLSISHDGGTTWNQSSVPLPAGFNQGAADPMAKFDDQGRLFVSFSAATFQGAKPPLTDPAGEDADGTLYRTYGFTASNGIFLVSSDDGGVSFSTPVAIASNVYTGHTRVPFDIKPDIAIDTFRTLPNHQLNPNYGNIYAVWSRYYPAGQFPGEPNSTGGSTIQIAVSTDGGATFTVRLPPASAEHPVPIGVIRDSYFSGIGPGEGLGAPNWAHLSIGPEGDVYVAFFDFGAFVTAHSTDAARSFDSPDRITGYRTAFDPTNGTADTASGPDNIFRTQPVRNIVVDPLHPGTVYVAEPITVLDAAGTEVDSGDVYFARSTDYGVTFDTSFQVGGRETNILNDENLGKTGTGAADDVLGRQFFARLAIDPAGNLAAIWDDTRRDPANRQIDVFGAVSTDGGQNFSPNFRISDATFDADAGAFISPTGDSSTYLGDFLGLALADGNAYAAWTDTRTGNQDIFFSRFPITPVAAAPDDRFEPNDDPATATDLGSVIDRHLPKLRVNPGDIDYFCFTSLATGDLSITVNQAQGGSRLSVQLLDADGSTLLTESSDVFGRHGKIVGQQISFPSLANHQYVVRIAPRDEWATDYSLDLQALTSNLGYVVSHTIDGTIDPGDQAYYLVTAAASGSLSASLERGQGFSGNIAIEFRDPSTLAVLSSDATSAVVAANRDQQFLIRIAAPAGTNASGAFKLHINNLDAYSTADRKQALFPAGDGPSQGVLGDVNNDGRPDLVVTDGLSNTVSVLLGNGDGTFQAPRQFAIGAFVPGSVTGSLLSLFRRDVVLADFNHDGHLDMAVTNKDSSDISVLLGNGDGTFQPQRRFDATSVPFGIDTGDFNGDSIPDLAVIDATNDLISIAILLGRGDGTFRHETLINTGFKSVALNGIKVADINSDHHDDILYEGSIDEKTHILLGHGDGTFSNGASFDGGGPGLDVADLNGDHIPDVVATSFYLNKISVVFGQQDGTFSDPVSLFGGEAPVSVKVADIASIDEDGQTLIGKPDGIPDLISAGSGALLTSFQGLPELFVSAGLGAADDDGNWFAPAMHLAFAQSPLSLAVGDINGDDSPEIAFVDKPGVQVYFPLPPAFGESSSVSTARNLGDVVHVVEPELTIVPNHESAFYAMTVPIEAAGRGDEVIDFNGNFEFQDAGGIQMEILDSTGKVLAQGEHLRLVAAQGSRLYVHVFGQGQGTGAYTLDIAVLPQLISIEGQSLLTGADGAAAGPTQSLVLGFQGDRLDSAAAEDPYNYTITWSGRDGVSGTPDDRIIAIGDGTAQSVIYNPSANVDVLTGLTYPTAVKQTVTFLFKDPLPAGTYRVEISPRVQVARFSESEFVSDHPVVTRLKTGVVDGADLIERNAVSQSDAAAAFARFKSGTPFLSQLQGDLGALLDRNLTAGEDISVTDSLIAQLRERLASGLTGAASTSFLALFLDPVSLDIQDPTGEHASYNLTSGQFANSIPNAFVSVASHVELVIIPEAAGQFALNVDDVPATARGGAVLLSMNGEQTFALTDALRGGQRAFQFNFDSTARGSGLASFNQVPLAPAIDDGNVEHAAISSPGTFLFTSPVTAPAAVQQAVSFSGLARHNAGRLNANRAAFNHWGVSWNQVFSWFTETIREYFVNLMKQMNDTEKAQKSPENLAPGGENKSRFKLDGSNGGKTRQIDTPIERNSRAVLFEEKISGPANEAHPLIESSQNTEESKPHAGSRGSWAWLALVTFSGLNLVRRRSPRHNRSSSGCDVKIHQRKEGDHDSAAG